MNKGTAIVKSTANKNSWKTSILIEQLYARENIAIKFTKIVIIEYIWKGFHPSNCNCLSTFKNSLFQHPRDKAE